MIHAIKAGEWLEIVNYFHCSPYTEYEFGVLAVNNVGRGQKSTPVIATTGETSKYCLALAKLNNYINIINNIIKQFTSKLTLLHTIRPWLQIRAIKMKNSVTVSAKAQALFRAITQFVHINQVFYVPVTYNKRLLEWKRAGNFSLYLISLHWGIFLLTPCKSFTTQTISAIATCLKFLVCLINNANLFLI